MSIDIFGRLTDGDMEVNVILSSLIIEEWDYAMLANGGKIDDLYVIHLFTSPF